MNTKTLITIATAAIALLGAGSAFAQEGATEFPEVNRSTLTRAQVQAEALAARRVGAISNNDRLVELTPAQAAAIEMAGLQALQMQVAAR